MVLKGRRARPQAEFERGWHAKRLGGWFTCNYEKQLVSSFCIENNSDTRLLFHSFGNNYFNLFIDYPMLSFPILTGVL